MSIQGLLIGVLLVTLTIFIAALPLLRKRAHTNDTSTHEKQRERLMVYYERVLRNVRDLDEDHDLGKLDEAQYAAEREFWMQRGVQALKALDTLLDGQLSSHGTDTAALDQAINDAIEAAVAKVKSHEPTP